MSVRGAVAALLLAVTAASAFPAMAQAPDASAPNAPASAPAAPVSAPVAPAAAPAPGTSDTPMPPPEQAEALLRSDRFRHLASELRCLVCQNQTLADSSAELAIDLRNEVLRQMAAGRDDAQIKTRLVDRYGEFVLYRPAFSARNLALWVGPAVLMAIGAFAVWRLSRRGGARTHAATGIDEAALQRVERLLAEDPPGRPPAARG